MQVNITGHHVEVTPPLHDYVTKKLEKVHKRFANITNVHVTLTMESKQRHIAKATMNLSQGVIQAHAEEEDMYAAIDGLMDKLARQVTKHNEKLSDHGEGI